MIEISGVGENFSIIDIDALLPFLAFFLRIPILLCESIIIQISYRIQQCPFHTHTRPCPLVEMLEVFGVIT